MSVRKFQDGQSVKLKGCTNTSWLTRRLCESNVNDPLNVVGIIKEINGYSGYNVSFPTFKGHYVMCVETKYLEATTALSKKENFLASIEKHKETIKIIEDKIKNSQARIDFMEEVETEDFDENEFKAYQTLCIIESSDTSKLEKAKLIAQLINPNK